MCVLFSNDYLAKKKFYSTLYIKVCVKKIIYFIYKQDREIDFSKFFPEMSDELSEVSKRQIIIKYKERHPNLSKYAIAKYVKELGIEQSTLYDVFKRFEIQAASKEELVLVMFLRK